MLQKLRSLISPATDFIPDGAWQSEAYGWLLTTQNGRVNTFQTTSQSCFALHTFSGRMRQNQRPTPLGKMRLAIEGDELAIHFGIADGPIMSQPTTVDHQCRTNPDQLTSVIYNFDVFWQTFADQYPFFELYGVDWRAQYERYRPQISEGFSSAELLDVIKQLVAPINDDHLSIEWGGEEWTPYKGKPNWRPHIREVVAPIASKYVRDLEITSDRIIRHGWLSTRIGYLMLATFGISDDIEADLKVLLPKLTEILAQFSEAKELVIDLRFNEGGYDPVALAIASLFAKEQYLVLRKSNKIASGQDEWQEKYIEPAAAFSGSITLLTSSLTVSAADVFTLALKQLPNVRHVGERTAGFFSDSLPRFFPNGNRFNLSHQIYQDPQGNELEGQGCIPDHIIPLRLDDARAGNDVALDWVLAGGGFFQSSI